MAIYREIVLVCVPLGTIGMLYHGSIREGEPTGMRHNAVGWRWRFHVALTLKLPKTWRVWIDASLWLISFSVYSYFFVTSNWNVKAAAVRVPEVYKIHALKNLCTNKLYSNGFVLLLCVELLSKQHMPWARLSCPFFYYYCMSRD